MEKSAVRARVRQIFGQYVTKASFADSEDFFSLGGNSLQGALVITQIERVFGVSISDAQAKRLRTVDNLVSFIVKSG